jgi:dTDP-4-dehydrorhamnose 3,5-epimerase
MDIKFEKIELEGIIIIHSSSFEDERGWLRESYNENTFFENGITEKFLQEKNSFSKFNVLRGLHFQNDPFAQGKLVRCTSGSIFDVVVDVRENSKTFGKSFGMELTDNNGYQIYIPTGFAHGFVVTNKNGAMFNYHITHNHFNKQCDSGIYFNDSDIGIKWPINTSDMIVSDKDKNLPTLKDFKN